MVIGGGWVLPTIYALGSLWVFVQADAHWRAARLTAVFALIATVGMALTIMVWAQFGEITPDPLGLMCAVLVSTLGWVIVQYSGRYLEGEPGQVGFVRAMLFTLFAVGVLVVSDHLFVIALAWTGTSLGLHHLLTFYRHRQAAQVVAHKKFLVSRLAELCLVVALALIYHATGTLSLTGLNAYLADVQVLPISVHIAAVFFVLAAILKTAQLPLHGWLIQVMEAPTPVSALLHAGVVNIGGFVLIRLGELISLAPVAQAVLVVVGSLTAVFAGLVMLTRISIKVRLAWSTCAQMGFMMMEIGLGLYALALLHLIAHSAYKAYSFLSAGETVNAAREKAMMQTPAAERSLVRYLAAPFASALLVAASLAAWQSFLPAMQVPFVALFILALGLASLAWSEQELTMAQLIRSVLSAGVLIQLYLIWHLLFDGTVAAAGDPGILLSAWVVILFLAFYLCQIWLRLYPAGRFARSVYPWAYAGFYLDETFTRLTFRVWPVRFSPVQSQTLVNRFSAPQGKLP